MKMKNFFVAILVSFCVMFVFISASHAGWYRSATVDNVTKYQTTATVTFSFESGGTSYTLERILLADIEKTLIAVLLTAKANTSEVDIYVNASRVTAVKY